MFKQYTYWKYYRKQICWNDKHRRNTDVQTIQRLKSNVPSLKTALYGGHRLHEYWRSPPHPSNRVRVFCANQYYRHVKSPRGGSIWNFSSATFLTQKACCAHVVLFKKSSRRISRLLSAHNRKGENTATKIQQPIITRVSIFSISDSNSLSLSKVTHLSEF